MDVYTKTDGSCLQFILEEALEKSEHAVVLGLAE